MPYPGHRNVSWSPQNISSAKSRPPHQILAIPALTITPQQQVSFGFKRFDLDTANRLEDHIVARLIDYPEIDYDAHAAILYDLAGQAVTQTRNRFADDNEQTRSVVRGHAKAMAESIFSQMKQNMWREHTNFRVSLTSAFGELRPQTFDTAGTSFIRDFKTPPDQKQEIRKYILAAPVAFECHLMQTIPVSSARTIILGEVKRMYVRETLMDPESHYVDQIGIDAVGRLGGHLYARQFDQFERVTPTVEEFIGFAAKAC